MTSTTGPQCAGPLCSRPVERRATGRPGRYCSPACRQRAYRERVARAEGIVRQAAELDAAKAETARLWPQVEVAALDVSETADAVLSYAAVEDQEDRGALEWKLRELHAHVARLEDLALGFRRAARRLARFSES